MTAGRPSPAGSTDSTRRITPGAIATGLFGAWHRFLNDLLRAAMAAASRAPSALRHARVGLAKSLASGVRQTVRTSRRAVVDTLDVASAIPVGIFATWHRLVSAIVNGATRSGRSIAVAARTWAAQWPRVRAYHADPARAFEADRADDRAAAVAVGARAFVFGIVLAGAVASLPTGLPGPGILTLAGEVVWAAVRFVIIALLIPQDATVRSRLSAAFLAGLVPYAFGATAALRFVSLVLSAVLTRRGLLGAGVPSRATDFAIGWSFGGQAGAIALGWIARAGVALLANA